MRQKHFPGHSQDDKFNMILFDLFHNLIQALTTHTALAIRNQDNLPLELEFLAVCDDHLHGQNKGGDGWTSQSETALY